MRFFITILSMLMSVGSFAQTNFNKGTIQLNDLLYASSDKDELLVWVFFYDKGENIASYFANPESVVSEKSLKRRAKVLPPDELISEMDLPVNSEYIEKIVSLGFELKQKSKWFNGVSGYVTISEIGLISQLSTVKSLDVVHKFKKNYSIEEDASNQSQNNSGYQADGVNSYNYGQSFTQMNQINVPAVHDLGYTGQGITICSMDAGFDNLAHEVFSSMSIIAMWDFVDNDPDPSQLGGHGTSTLSTVGGFKEGQLIGPAFNADFLLARTEDILSETPVEEDNWIAALEWADSIGVDVTTTSLGYLDFDPPFQGYTWEDMDGNTAIITIAADLAVKIGIVVVTSASNYGFNPNHNTLAAPADGDSVITVGAVGSNGERTSFSSVGPTVDGRIKPDLMAMGSGVYVARSSSPTSYGISNGTSFSCPILAGAAALVLSADPTLTPMEVLDLLRQTASRSSNPDNLMGWGIINTLDAIELIPVPVELTLFSASYVNGSVQLEWVTATETNNSGFEVLKRYEGTSFEKIGFVVGSGSTTVETHYSFTDENNLVGRIYYRLKQIDFEGGFAFSNEIMVEIPIPVELTLFSGSYVNGSVQLEWVTATETNNSGFEVQKKYESTSFEKIGFVVGSGSTTVETRYSFTDKNNLVGRIYYRLKQIDFEGGFAFSNEIMVEIPKITDYQLSQNYPNPFNPSTTIKFSVPTQSKIKITLYDIIGNEVRTLFDGIQPSGVHEINLTADNLPSGVYFVSMTAENFNKAIKITLMK